MASVRVTLPSQNMDEAVALASAIRDAATMQYTNVEGNTVNVTVGDVEVEA